MKKFFTLITVAMMALSANAQRIAFSAEDVADKGTLDGKEFANGDFKLTITDTDGKIAIDENAQWFGTAEAQEKSAGGRLKSGGKSSSKNFITVAIPAAGTLKVWARTGSNTATDRTIVITQGETELYNQIVQESDAVTVKGLDTDNPDKETNVYPIISVNVAEGEATVTYPVGSMNFYAFEFVAGGDPTGIQTVKVAHQNANAIYNLAGQQVNDGFKGLVIKNGKKIVMK